MFYPKTQMVVFLHEPGNGNKEHKDGNFTIAQFSTFLWLSILKPTVKYNFYDNKLFGSPSWKHLTKYSTISIIRTINNIMYCGQFKQTFWSCKPSAYVATKWGCIQSIPDMLHHLKMVVNDWCFEFVLWQLFQVLLWRMTAPWILLNARIFQLKTWLSLSTGSDLTIDRGFNKMLSQTCFQVNTE